MSTEIRLLGRDSSCQQLVKRYVSWLCLGIACGLSGYATASTSTIQPVALADNAETQVCLLPQDAEAQQVEVELAMNNAQRAQGLMMRETLAENAGMLFVYPDSAVRSFWMYRTLLPLDIAFIDAQGIIVDIQQMQPCRSYWSNRCPNYPAAAPFLYALEVNLNSFARWQVQVGDQVTAADCATPLAIHTPY